MNKLILILLIIPVLATSQIKNDSIFNDESNFNNFVATNDERRFFTQHRYPVSFFIEKNFCVCWENER